MGNKRTASITAGLVLLAASGLSAATPASALTPTIIQAGGLSAFNNDNASGDADGVQWLSSIRTLVLAKPGDYRIDGIVAANIRVSASAGTVNIYGTNKDYDDLDVNTQTKRAAFFNNRAGGDNGTVSVGASGTVNAPGYTTSALVGVFVPNTSQPSNPDSVIQASSANNATINLHNFTIFGDGQNAVRPLQGNMSGVMTNMIVVNPGFGVSSSRPGGSGGGAFEIGANGSLTKSYLKVADDAIKPKLSGASASNIRVDLQNSGAAVQFGWSPGQSQGNVTVSNINVNGYIRQTSGDDRPGAGESVVSGVIGGNTDNYSATGIHVHPDTGKTFPNIVRLQFPDASAVPTVQIGMDLSSNTSLTNVTGTGATHSFDFIRPTGVAQQTVHLAVTKTTATGEDAVTPTSPTYGQYFTVPSTVTLANP
ncbi:glycosyl hydrolase family 49 [Arthrobacter sp. AG258]|uniref:hypothetical protein n=1 Tax=Arthrobacter sp. AG258 TaxID=2183899 RepID=UPI0010621C7C|nr:hypothetical protein [Arthrobacter sp. AG258]TDT74700.1 glycosyl hydrolase family 49 [Arthrobacter sp. AG258]